MYVHIKIFVFHCPTPFLPPSLLSLCLSPSPTPISIPLPHSAAQA